MKKSICFCLLICMLSLFVGCGSSEPEENTIAVDKKGRITDTIVEDFDKDYYDSDELQSEIEAELAKYNQNYASDPIELKKFGIKNGKATLQLLFSEAKYYEEYTESTFFTGTVEEAQAEGYELTGDMVDTDGEKTGVSSLEDPAKAKIVILENDETVNVEVPGKILAVSGGGNVSITGKKQASVAEGGMSYIIYQ